MLAPLFSTQYTPPPYSSRSSETPFYYMGNTSKVSIEFSTKERGREERHKESRGAEKGLRKDKDVGISRRRSDKKAKQIGEIHLAKMMKLQLFRICKKNKK